MTATRLRGAPHRGAPAIVRTNLTIQVYDVLRDALLEGRLLPHQRLRIRDLSAVLDVSETPVREAVMQLVRERALELQTARSLTVPLITVATFLELREIRLRLEGFAAREAVSRIGKRELAQLERTDAALVRATAAGHWNEVVGLNWRFHAAIYDAASMPNLFNMIQALWLRCGPLFSLLWPAGPPAYARGRRRHIDVLEAIRAADGRGMCAAIKADLIEGSATLVATLTALEAGTVDEATLRRPELDLPSLLRPSCRGKQASLNG